MGHGKGTGTARWDIGKEEGLLGGTGRCTVKWDLQGKRDSWRGLSHRKEEGLLCLQTNSNVFITVHTCALTVHTYNTAATEP